jgi:hypothetical protein
MYLLFVTVREDLVTDNAYSHRIFLTAMVALPESVESANSGLRAQRHCGSGRAPRLKTPSGSGSLPESDAVGRQVPAGRLNMAFLGSSEELMARNARNRACRTPL